MVIENIDIPGFIGWFEGIGGFDVILPFLLIFTITFAILDKANIFDKPSVNVILSVIAGFFLVMQSDMVLIIQGFLPRISMLILTFLMILLVAGSLGFLPSDSWSGIAVFVAIGSVIWAMGASVGWNVPWLSWFTPEDISVLIVLGVFVLIIWFIVKKPGPGDTGGKIWNAFKSLGEGLGGKKD